MDRSLFFLTLLTGLSALATALWGWKITLTVFHNVGDSLLAVGKTRLYRYMTGVVSLVVTAGLAVLLLNFRVGGLFFIAATALAWGGFLLNRRSAHVKLFEDVVLDHLAEVAIGSTFATVFYILWLIVTRMSL